MKLQINDPCHEDWNKMKIGLISRHCQSCNKNVMDFTKMNRAEIITYLLSNPNDDVCGRMNRDQFDFHHEDIPVLIETLKKSKNPNPFLIIALVCLSLSACAQNQGNIKTPTGGKHHVVGKVHTPVPNDSIPKDSIPKDSTKPVKRPLKGKVACEPKIIEMGMVEPVEKTSMGEVAPVAGNISLEQNHPPVPNERYVYQFAEKMPEYKGGIDAMFAFITKNLNYPTYEKRNGIQGNVYVRFVVETDGSLTHPEIMNSVDGAKNFDSEVIRVISQMPKWTPGENNGQKVPVYMTIPFQFKLK